ncbi:muscle M-line assembly protein unc-89-like [Pseudorasbora parva]|uniref:muscle M-line assembly protein unc-89-like n=1 Tax=Pseudorasbora parva TaxID=51549 RepID=UPI00351F7F53
MDSDSEDYSKSSTEGSAEVEDFSPPETPGEDGTDRKVLRTWYSIAGKTQTALLSKTEVHLSPVLCKEGPERFRGRLKLDHQTGSLTITHTTTEDSGLYKLQITNSISKTDSLKIFNVTVRGPSDVGRELVSVKEGDSVTLHTGVITNQQDRVQWYFNDIRIARINGDQSQICTDVQCNNGTERFRDRLKLDHQTGSLTIRNIRTEDSGVYHLQINSRNRETIFNITVHDVPAAEQHEMKMVKEGESVTLYPGEVKNPNDEMAWYHNDVLIAEITGDQSQICADDQCKDRLKLDPQTGSLTIMNTRTEDSGLYQLQISISRIRSSFSIRRIKSFSVAVSGEYNVVSRTKSVLL